MSPEEATTMLRVLEHFSHEDRSRQSLGFSLRKRMLRGDLRAVSSVVCDA